jgi:hypothetical protein
MIELLMPALGLTKLLMLALGGQSYKNSREEAFVWG